MTKKDDKSVMTLQKLVIIIGLVSSLITATIGIGKEVAGVAKDWVVSDNKIEVIALQEDVSKLKIEIESVRNQLNSNMLMAFAKKSQDHQYVTTSYKASQKQGLNFGWIMGIIGIVGLATFGIWHYFHDRKHASK